MPFSELISSLLVIHFWFTLFNFFKIILFFLSTPNPMFLPWSTILPCGPTIHLAVLLPQGWSTTPSGEEVLRQ